MTETHITELSIYDDEYGAFEQNKHILNLQYLESLSIYDAREIDIPEELT